MTLWVCKCLNVSLESDTVEEISDIKKLELSPAEQRDQFFNEKLILSSGNNLKTVVVQPALIEQQVLGRWIFHSCLACGQKTHATLQDKNNIALIRKEIQTTINQVNTLKKSNNFSPVFNLLVPEVTSDIEMKENIDTNNMKIHDARVLPTAQQAIGSLSKQLNQTLQSELEAVEETVRQFRDQKYAEFEAYRERAQRDHKILASIVNRTRDRHDGDWKNTENGPLSPQLLPSQRRRLSSIKDAKKINQHITKNNKNFPPEEDSLDAEDIFDLEGTDSNMSRNDYISDQDDYDDDNSGSNDEGIHILRGRGGRPAKDGAAFEIARSLPISMPNVGHERHEPHELEDEEEPQDIAASIKALARSVHGDVFELPRPRFSTQI
ncbi:hypothetical protein EVAR_33955_1 [Eumeta japonica]|uniref:Uncharacterized protein n=1 Tax=Eumeta variegata TaxID=151549 RepID=A0A4C1W015_EUMVA|nr:hypothetical protein EVAR_33955_1 [Eumeta japonica]